MFNAKAYSVSSATSPLAPTVIARRDLTENDVYDRDFVLRKLPLRSPLRPESGSSFQRVLDEARRQMARYYLSDSVLELNEAAYLLGYEDANSFARAFRVWEGMPPRDWQETHRATAVN